MSMAPIASSVFFGRGGRLILSGARSGEQDGLGERNDRADRQDKTDKTDRQDKAGGTQEWDRFARRGPQGNTAEQEKEEERDTEVQE